jgi:hypothetical protein
MIPYCRKVSDITNRQMAVFRKVQAIVDWLPEGLTCHEVCAEVVKRVPQLIHYRGKFNGYDHSWLVFTDSCTLIDPYPWATASGPVILTTAWLSPYKLLYNGGPV